MLARTQIRGLKRRPAYPQYAHSVPPRSGKKDHRSYFQRYLKEWLGPKNIRGEYHRNIYYYPPTNHTPRYIRPNGATIAGDARAEPRTSNVPFPMNPNCTTASILSAETKAQIVRSVEGGKHAQEVAHQHKITLQRVEAILALNKIETQWSEQVC